MTPPNTFIDRLSRMDFLKSRVKRRVVFAVAAIVFIILGVFPQHYRAAVSLTPTDPSTLGLSGTLGQLGAINSVFGSQAQVEVAMKIARSVATRETVIKKLDLVKRLGRSDVETSRWLDGHVSTRAVRGGIVEIESVLTDADLAKQLVAAYSAVVQSQLAIIGRRQTAYKREILVQLVEDADKQLEKAQSDYDQFRLKTRYSDPSRAIASIGDRIPVIKDAIKAKEVELNAAQQFATDDNMSVRQIIAQIDALKTQLAQLQALNPGEDSSIGRVVAESTVSQRLERKLLIARQLYNSYSQFLKGTSVEDLTSMANVRILEPPYVDTARQYNLGPLTVGILILLMALAVEFYEARPPVGDGLRRA